MTPYEKGIEKLGFGYMLDGVWYWTDSTDDTKGGWYGDPMDLRLPKHAAFAWRVLEAAIAYDKMGNLFKCPVCYALIDGSKPIDTLYNAVCELGK